MVTKRSTKVGLKWALSFIICLILMFLALHCRHHVKVKVHHSGVLNDASPLVRLMDKVSVDEFQMQVKAHPEWINQKSGHLPDYANMSPLTAAAITERTNYARVLIDHGANVEESLLWAKANNSPVVLDFIKRCIRADGVE